MNLWELKVFGCRPVYALVLRYLRYVPGHWLKAYLRDGVVGHTVRPVLYTNRDGIHFELDVHDIIQRDIYIYNYYEPEDVRAFRRLVGPGDVVFDVGANIGQYTLLASKLVGSPGHVFAFEPSPDVLPKLKKHLLMNHADNVELAAKAVAESDGTASFYPAAQESNQGVGSLLPAESYRAELRSSQAVEVEVTTLDSFCDQHGIESIDLLKVDVEGLDLDVLRGAERILARSPHVVVMSEVEPLNFVQRGFSFDDFIDYMQQRGFSPYYAVASGRLRALSEDDVGKTNLFFKRQPGRDG